MKITFEHKFIPRIVDNSNRDEFELDSVEIFDNFEFVQGSFSDTYPKEEGKFDWKAFSIAKEMNMAFEYWLLRFPEPTQAGEARWGIIMHKADKAFKYFLLEKTDGEELALTMYEKGEHKELSSCPAATTAEEFVNLVLEHK